MDATPRSECAKANIRYHPYVANNNNNNNDKNDNNNDNDNNNVYLASRHHVCAMGLCCKDQQQKPLLITPGATVPLGTCTVNAFCLFHNNAQQ